MVSMVHGCIHVSTLVTNRAHGLAYVGIVHPCARLVTLAGDDAQSTRALLAMSRYASRLIPTSPYPLRMLGSNPRSHTMW